jgi:hypothetical protein
VLLLHFIFDLHAFAVHKCSSTAETLAVADLQQRLPILMLKSRQSKWSTTKSGPKQTT